MKPEKACRECPFCSVKEQSERHSRDQYQEASRWELAAKAHKLENGVALGTPCVGFASEWSLCIGSRPSICRRRFYIGVRVRRITRFTRNLDAWARPLNRLWF